MFIKKVLAFTLIGIKSLALAQSSAVGRPCGLKIAPCPNDLTCIPDNPTCTNTYRCKGTCAFKNKYPPCGGNSLNPPKCDENSTCQDDPRLPDSCGMACDFLGICIPKDTLFCGGFAGFQCPPGKFCYDVLNDGCDPNNGGADCGGICL